MAMAFKVSTNDIPTLIKLIKTQFKSLAPEMPFKYHFLDESFEDMYRTEQRVGKVALTFAMLTIFIACLGLFGLVTYISEQRTKEVGIRKVLGASIGNITVLLTIDFIKLVAIAMVIAAPLAWLLMNKWLQDFAYRISISWWIFAVAGFIALLIALLTVSYQAIKAAVANPVKSLRTE